MEVVILATAMWPIVFALGAVAAYCVMTQRQALAEMRGARFAWRYRVLRDIPNGSVRRAIRQSTRSGWQVSYIQYDSSTKRSHVTLSAYVAV